MIACSPSPPPLSQVFNVATSPIVQNAWQEGQPLAVHGVVYRVTDGVLVVCVGVERGCGYTHVCMAMQYYLDICARGFACCLIGVLLLAYGLI